MSTCGWVILTIHWQSPTSLNFATKRPWVPSGEEISVSPQATGAVNSASR
jgi:hypothetical protein